MPTEAIKTTLLPFLDALCKKEDDEVVFAIAEEYANIAYKLFYTVQCWVISTPSPFLISKTSALMMRQLFEIAQ
jgi:hypothetical protein